MRLGVRLLNSSFKTMHIRQKNKPCVSFEHNNGNKYHVFGKMHRTPEKVNDVT